MRSTIHLTALALVAGLCLAGSATAQPDADHRGDRRDPGSSAMSMERMIDQVRGSDLPEPTKRRLEVMLERQAAFRADREADRPMPPLARPRDRGPEMRDDRPHDRRPKAGDDGRARPWWEQFDRDRRDRARRDRDRDGDPMEGRARGWPDRRPGPPDAMDRPHRAYRDDHRSPRLDRETVERMRERREAWRERVEDDRRPRMHHRRHPDLRGARPDRSRFDRRDRFHREPRFDRDPRFEGRDPVEMRRRRDPVDMRRGRDPLDTLRDRDPLDRRRGRALDGDRRLDRLERDLEALSRQIERMKRDFDRRR
jgi:hypothetical protein